MLVSVVQTPGGRRFAAPPSTTVQCPTQRWCYRPGSPTVTRAQPAQVVRPRRATVATASPEATAAWENLPEGSTKGLRRLTQARPAEAVQKVAPRPEPELDFGYRMPAPLPSSWRDRYELCQECPTLGGGAFAEVFKVRHRFTNECFAVKVMHRPNFALRGIEKQIENEITAMRMASEVADSGHSEGNIVQLLEYTEECDYVFLLLELCEQGDLLRKLNAEPLQRFHEDEGAVWARQLLLGLRTLHRLGFLHRDIKPDNLLCTEGSVLKIADFGWCSLSEEAPTCLAGTFQYMAPEVLHNKPQTEAVDVWSAGVSLHQMLVGRALLTTYLGPGATQLTECDPHRATSVKQRRLLAEISAICPPSYDRRPPHLSPLCWDFLRQLLIPEAESRITVDAALRHPWILRAAGPMLTEVRAHANVAPEVAFNGEPEDTGYAKENDQRFMDVPRSPPCNKIKDALSPSSGPMSPNSIENVPTPLKPRSWDPHRNIAYTPPMENDLDADNLDENSTPEVSPERKARLLMSSDRVSTFNLSPTKETVEAPVLNELDQTQPARTPLSRLSPPAPPPRTLGRRLGGSVIISRQSHGAYESPAVDGEAQLLTGSTSGLLRQPRFDHNATNVLLRKLHNCNEQLRQINSALRPEHKLQGLDSGNEGGYPGDVVTNLDSTYSSRRDNRALQELDHIGNGFDVLTATAPPLIGHATPGLFAPSRALDATSRTTADGGLPSARGRENMLPPNLVAVSSASTSVKLKGAPMVRNGVVCYAAATRYTPMASPTKAGTTAGQPPPSASRITQAKTGQPQQGQRYVLTTVPTPGVPQLSPSQAAMWTQSAGASQLRASGVLPRRASVVGRMQACDQR
uniref:Protein kinase domain-containing protein n=1 Tax=Alexandrium catenella TaxID=2925 RepID=A0A7S1RGK3_ALECA|mmetsp:Transcript_57307/g.153466  ORF Transcript_57307/g.153466 Transcript_57307/m.153466 type:complete len:858 (+) Transcript_57307:45-2618(+)